MSAGLPNSTRCPDCGNSWNSVGTVAISGTVEAEHDPDGRARIGIVLQCDECEKQHEAWLSFSDFCGIQP
jgi:hypothetical protein